MRISVRQGSVVDADVDVLVNASNTNAWLGSGVSGAIRGACGAGFQEHIVAQMQACFGRVMEPGEVFVTDAGTHPRARYVAHVAVMDYREGSAQPRGPDRARIQRATENLWAALGALEGAESLRIGMVALGAGTGGLGVRLPTTIACETLKGRSFGEVVFHGFTPLELANVLSVVLGHFEVDTAGVDPDLLAFARQA
jgi:O-acetyl-ADP-ribose deacetylase (regulator of RNase III)